MHFGRYNYAGAVMNGKIYVAGGRGDRDSILHSVECYNPVNDEWVKIASMNHQRENFALVELSGNLYAMGHHKSIERYDPVQEAWTVVRALFHLNCFFL